MGCSQADRPVWDGLWRAGETGPVWIPLAHGSSLTLSSEELLPPETVVFSAKELMLSTGFSYGRMLAGVVDSWRSAQYDRIGPMAPDAAEFFFSPKELLFRVVRDLDLFPAEAGRVEFSASPSPLRVTVKNPPHCGSPACNGDFECDTCDDMYHELFSERRKVPAADLYAACDALFSGVDPSRIQLAGALYAACMPMVAAPVALSRRLESLSGGPLSGLAGLSGRARARRISDYELAFALADAVRSAFGTSPEEEGALSALLRADAPAPGSDLFAGLLDELSVLRAIFA